MTNYYFVHKKVLTPLRELIEHLSRKELTVAPRYANQDMIKAAKKIYLLAENKDIEKIYDLMIEEYQINQ